MEKNNKVIENTGMGFSSALTLVFITLKLTNYINWPWIWVFSPLWIGIGLIILFFMVILIIGRIKKGKWWQLLCNNNNDCYFINKMYMEQIDSMLFEEFHRYMKTLFLLLQDFMKSREDIYYKKIAFSIQKQFALCYTFIYHI